MSEEVGQKRDGETKVEEEHPVKKLKPDTSSENAANVTSLDGFELVDYSKFSFVVRGDTKAFKEKLVALGGKWNSYLKGGAGWVFSKKSKAQVETFLKDPSAPVQTEKENSEIVIADYSDKSIIVRGDTRAIKDQLKSAGGRWNPSSKGWIFPKSKRGEVEALLASGGPSAATKKGSTLVSEKKDASEAVLPGHSDTMSKKVCQNRHAETNPDEVQSQLKPDTNNDIAANVAKLNGFELVDYSKFSFVVRGDTKAFKEKLVALGGKWNSYLKGGAGWVFSKKSKAQVEAFLKDPSAQIQSTEKKETGEIMVTDYSDKSIIVRGDTRAIKDQLKSAGGRWNKSLKGWIFAKSKREEVEAVLAPPCAGSGSTPCPEEN